MGLLTSFKRNLQEGIVAAEHQRDVQGLMPRSLVLLRPKPAFARWMAANLDEHARKQAHKHGALLDILRKHRVPYLMPPFEDNAAMCVAYVEQNYEYFLRTELRRLSNVERRAWPEPLTLMLLHEWFDIEVHPRVLDATTWGRGGASASDLR
jgi:hypothetical protein